MGIHMKNNINYTGATSLNTLRDVVIDSPATGQGIVWDEEKQQWTNGEVSTNDMVEITLAEYEVLSTEEKNNDTTYFITDADNIDPGSVGTAGTLKPWLYDSENEVVIGVYDGKPLYRRTLIYENYVVSVGRNELPFDVDNIDTIVNSKGYITNSIHTSIRPLNTYVHDSSGDSLYYVIYFSDKYIHLQANDTWSSPNIYFTIEYTKTTDAEGSGVNLMPYSFVQNGGGCNYSTEEQVVGTWIDGRPIYQKTIIVEGISGTNGSFPTTLDDTCEIISYRGIVRIDTSYVSINTDWDNSYRANIYAPTISNFNWSLGSWGGVSNAIFRIIVEYIKTTD